MRKFIGSIAVIGILYSLVRLFEGGTGGGSFENAFVGILYTIIAVFVVSLISVIINRRRLKEMREEIFLLFFTALVLLIVLFNK